MALSRCLGHRAPASPIPKHPESVGGPIGHGHGHGVIEGDDRAGGEAIEQLVQRLDLRPVGVLGAVRFSVDGGDRGLHLEGPMSERGSVLVSSSMPSVIW